MAYDKSVTRAGTAALRREQVLGQSNTRKPAKKRARTKRSRRAS